jgi:curli biogenesis system outer membrane secretion channel CsgG
MNKVTFVVMAILITMLWAFVALADRPPVQTFQEQLAKSCVTHGLNASCSLQEAYVAQLDCRDAGLPATCNIWELTHTK